MQEVASKVLPLFRGMAQELGIPFEVLHRGRIPTPEPERIDWDIFCVIAEGLLAQAGSVDALERLGMKVLELPAFAAIVRPLGLVANPSLLYRANFQWGGMRVFSHVTTDFEILPNGQMRGTITIPDNYQNCIPFFVICGGVMRRLPGVIGLPDATVKLTITGQSCTYDIDPPPT